MTIFAISNAADGDISDPKGPYAATLKIMANQLRGAKDYGIVYKAFYNQRVDKCITTELYIPTTMYFNRTEKHPVLLMFPGANGKASTYNPLVKASDADNTVQYYAEKYGFILVTVESYVNSGQYGDPTGPIGRFPATHPEDPANPWGKDAGWMRDIVLSGEVAIDTLDYALSEYPSADRNRVYSLGTSMGSMGSFSMGINYNDRFRAFVGTAGLTEIDYWDVSKIGKKPFLFIGGTEDPNGLDYMFYGIEKLKKELPGFEYILTGGAAHCVEWQPYMEYIFQWLQTK